LLERDLDQGINDKDKADLTWQALLKRSSSCGVSRFVPVPQPALRGGAKDGLSKSPGWGRFIGPSVFGPAAA